MIAKLYHNGMIPAFEFDPAKSEANSVKHGVDFVAAQQLWADDRLLIVAARSGPAEEARWVAIGSMDDKMWSAVFALREDRIRLISVRRSREKEAALYDEDF
jgi:uncharacterized DUF497 family protein